jgi:hypothetical protein
MNSYAKITEKGHAWTKFVLMNHLMTKLYYQATCNLRKEDGQGALEYIAIVVGLIVLVALGFQIAGVDIFQTASTFVERVIGSAGG